MYPFSFNRSSSAPVTNFKFNLLCAKAFSNTATPSGADKIHIAVISTAPFAAKNSIAD
jgi:hypothetical protein